MYRFPKNDPTSASRSRSCNRRQLDPTAAARCLVFGRSSAWAFPSLDRAPTLTGCRRRQIPPPRLDRVAQRPPKVQFQIEPGAPRLGLKGDTIRRQSDLGCKSFKDNRLIRFLNCLIHSFVPLRCHLLVRPRRVAIRDPCLQRAIPVRPGDLTQFRFFSDRSFREHTRGHCVSGSGLAQRGRDAPSANKLTLRGQACDIGKAGHEALPSAFRQ
jgi:hypothetical protein